jgi:hypothetical protein
MKYGDVNPTDDVIRCVQNLKAAPCRPSREDHRTKDPSGS